MRTKPPPEKSPRVMTAARRLAAILAADVAGYSRLMGEDEAGTAKIVRERREAATPIVRAYGGRLVKTTGDGVLLEFPSVVAAVECAILIQKMMTERNAALPEAKRILYRIGVNLGDVLIEGDDILGDGVNIAARLEGICEPGGVCVSALAFEHVRGRIEAEFADLGEQGLKNIMKPVRAYALPPDVIAAAKVEAPEAASGPASPPPEPREPPRLSLVVLPFANIGGDPSHEHFVDGVTESLTTDLSRMRAAVVIACNTAFAYKGKPLDVKTIGRELNVRYVLEGSVQRGGNRLRVNVQLIDAETGNHLWAERFDKPLADLFDMQDEIVARLAGALNAELIAAEARRAEQAPNPDSMDLYFQGLAWLNKGITPDTVTQARGFFDRAIAADPGNVDALVGSALADMRAGALDSVADPTALFAAAEAKLTKALSSVPDHARAHLSLGYLHIYTKRAAQGIAECEHALALDRNLAHAHALFGLGKHFLGRAEETEAHVAEALRLSPRDTMAYFWMAFAGVASAQLGRWEQAVLWFRRSIEANRNNARSHFALAAALAQLGRLEEARSAAKTGLAVEPAFTISRLQANLAARSDNPTFLARLEPIFDGMRKAGVPEQ
jgi:TolB-like protein/class 3 adenylate cyclase/Tfp pilus assembly protein PilF